MARIGAFDRHLEPLAWWEVELLPAGWYVDELLVEPAAGGVTGTVTSTLSDAALSATGTVVTPSTLSAILIGSSNNPSYRSGFYSPRRGGTPKYPSLWDGCVGAWCPSLGQTGLTLRDESVFGNHGTLQNMDPANDWVVSGGKGALDFDGVDDYVTLQTVNSMLVDRMTISAWVKVDNEGVSPDSHPILTTVGSYAYYFTVGGRYVNFYRGGPETWVTGSTQFSVGSWVHVAGVYDSSLRSVWLNGRLDGSVADSTPANHTANGSVYIAARGDYPLEFFGQLDDVRLYNRALTPSEIRLLATRRGVAYESKRRLAVLSGAASPSGTLAKTLDSATLTSSGTLSGGAATGSLSSTLADASLSSSGTLASGLTGSVSVTLGACVVSATGTVSAGASGTVTRTLDNATLSATGGAAGSVTGSVSSTLAAATCSSSGTLAAGLSGTVVRTLDAVTSSATGTVINGASGTVTQTLANATLASGGSLSPGLTAQVNRALESCVVSASGTLVSGLTGTLSVQLASATLQSGNIAVGGLRIKVGGEWKNANAFVKVTGTWRTATPYVKVSGVWKQ